MPWSLVCFTLTVTPSQEILPKAGLVYSEKGNLSEVLSKPMILPIKSRTLQKLEDMEKNAMAVASQEHREDGE
jgi:BBSome-interacting protein 1